MLFAIVIGMMGGAALAFLASRWLLGKVADRLAPQPQGRRVVAVCGMVFGAISLAPAIFLSVMGGGTLGMRVAAAMAGALGLGGFFSSLVLALEVVVATVVTVIGNVAIGAAIGVLAARSLGASPPGGGTRPRPAGPGKGIPPSRPAGQGP